MNYSSLENKLFLLNAIAKTNKNFEFQEDCDKQENTKILDKTKHLLDTLDNMSKKLDVLDASEDIA